MYVSVSAWGRLQPPNRFVKLAILLAVLRPRCPSPLHKLGAEEFAERRLGCRPSHLRSRASPRLEYYHDRPGCVLAALVHPALEKHKKSGSKIFSVRKPHLPMLVVTGVIGGGGLYRAWITPYTR